MRKISRKGLIRMLDKLTSIKVVERDRKCFTCGKTYDLTNGHLFTRGFYIVRWDMLNCHAQCVGCNFRHEFDPSVYQLKFIEKYGLETYKELYRKAHRPNKFSDLQLKGFVQELKQL